jgi:hypothetical protein
LKGERNDHRSSSSRIQDSNWSDFTLADAYDADYLDVVTTEDEDEAAERQALNARMAEWYGIG